MTDTVDSVIQQAFEVMRNVAVPMFTERGFVDVAQRLNGATSLGGLFEAMDYADQVCALPPVALAAFHDLRTSFQRIKEVRDAGETDQKKLGFAKLQIIHAAGMLQDARSGKVNFETEEQP